MKKLTLLTASLLLTLTSCTALPDNADTPLVCAYSQFDGKFSPFYADTVYDRDVVAMTHLSLLTTDRMGEVVYNAVEGETRAYNGTDYTYRGICDIDVKRNEDTTVYSLTLADDLYFSDGHKADADDIIFNYYVYLDPAYIGSSTLASYDIVGLEAYRSGSAPNIAGITKTGDLTVELVTNGYEAPAIYTLCGIDLAPMHYYGDESQYDYESNKFGHPFGDLSSVGAKTSQPMGLGPYRFDSYRDKTVYFSANDNYYKGRPKINTVQFRELSEADKITALTTGDADISQPTTSRSGYDRIRTLNSNGQLSGDVITAYEAENPGYGFIGINADTVKVGEDGASEQSKNLRRGLATVLAAYRDMAVASYYGDSALILDYPITSTSWASPRRSDPGYTAAYSVRIDGSPIYTTGMTAEGSYKAALEAAVEYFIAAGYTYDGSAKMLTAAPEGASMTYEVMIPAGGNGDHPAFQVLSNASAALKTVGITLEINDLSEPSLLWKRIDTGTQQLWSAAWNASLDPDMYQLYHSSGIPGKGGSDSNHYHIADKELDRLIIEARRSDDKAYRKSAYKACCDIILDWACEIPVYQRMNVTLVSTERVNTDTITPDITTYHGWMNDIERLELK